MWDLMNKVETDSRIESRLTAVEGRGLDGLNKKRKKKEKKKTHVHGTSVVTAGGAGLKEGAGGIGG